MLQELNEQISVISIYHHTKRRVYPYKINWKGRNYKVKEVGYYHKRRIGKTILHVFDVTDGAMAFRIVCDSDNLHWTLEEVSDGSPS